MKLFFGVLSVLFIIAAALLSALAVWGIYPVPAEIIWKVCVTLFIIAAVFAFLCLSNVLFFKKEKYSKEGNRAHRIEK